MKMTKPAITRWISAAILVTLLLCAAAKVFETPSPAAASDMVKLEVAPFETEGGWGYKILAGGETYIIQDRIPVLAGKQSFHTKEDAVSVGDLMVKKLMARQSPAITAAELLALHIQH